MRSAPPSRFWLFPRLLWSAGTDFAFAAVFLITWIAPDTFGERTVHHLTFVMLLEFIVVHSAGFMGAIGSREDPLHRRALYFTCILLFDSLFAGAFSLGYGSPWPLAAFVILCLAKLPNVVLRPPGFDGQMIVMANWAAMTALYLFGIFITVMANVPPLGVTPEVIARQEFGIEGLWPEEPYRVMAFGALYFTGLGIVSILNEVIPALRKRRTE